MSCCSNGVDQTCAASRESKSCSTCGSCSWCQGIILHATCKCIMAPPAQFMHLYLRLGAPLLGGAGAHACCLCYASLSLLTLHVLHLQGVNIMAFCKEYNAATQDKVGTVIPVEITVFEVTYSAGSL